VNEVFLGKGSFKMLPLLLRFGCDIQSSNNSGFKLVHDAVLGFQQDQVRCTKALLQLRDLGLDLEGRAADNCTALHLAAYRDEAALVTLLLDNGASPNGSSHHIIHNLETPLHLACKIRNSSVAPLLIRAGAALSPFDQYKSTPLHYAVKAQSDHLALLVQLGADINAQDGAGNTPLHYVASLDPTESLSSTEILINAGSNLDIANVDSQTPLAVAISTKCLAVIQLVLKMTSKFTRPLLVNHDVAEWASKQDFWSQLSSFIMTRSSSRVYTSAEVFTITLLIQSCFRITPPPTIISAILDHAECWIRSSAFREYPSPDGLRIDERSPIVPFIRSTPIIGAGRRPVRKVVIETLSHDQGFSSYPHQQGSYEGSYTWFDVVAEREGEADKGLEKVQLNVHGRSESKLHRIELRGVAGDGIEQRTAEWIRGLRGGDTVTVVPRALYPGWANFVLCVRVEVYSSCLL
jgi:ankyrin repeat protein